MHGRKFPLAVLVATPLLLSCATSEPKDLQARILEMGGQRCTDMPDWFCVTQKVPVDHHANSGPTTSIEYVVSIASEESKGVLFYLVGGPGESGVAVADPWLQFYDEKLKKNMDIVFLDRRGIGPDVTCPKAQARFSLARPSIEKPNEAITIAKSYATDCPAEFKPQARALLNFLDTDQAIRDLELFRQAIGSPKVWIYGYSYGTQFAQQYATAFPSAVNGVIIDGVVDLSLDYERYEAASVVAAEDILTRVFTACRKMTECQADMNGGDPAAVYKALLAKAAEQPIEVDFPQTDGTSSKRELTRNMLETSAFNALFGPDERATFLQALAAAHRNNPLPLLQLSYSYLKVDPQTLESVDDPTYYDAAYYGITCSEYGEGTADGDATARQIIEQAKAFSPKAPRLLEFFYMERLVCAFWPKRGPTTRPKPYAGGEFPTLIINADADPITPLSMSESVFSHAKNASMIIVQGGPHVSWGYKHSCVDDPVYNLLIDHKRPAGVTRCEQPLIGDYTELTLTDRASADGAAPVAHSRDARR
jgi:pimeloyl-ACP methyl ester carboxylesterase